MPYIHRITRDEMEPITDAFLDRICPDTKAGVINYLITVLLNQWMGGAPKYGEFNEAIGVLECAKQEFYRRQMVPYEKRKAKENGDVY